MMASGLQGLHNTMHDEAVAMRLDHLMSCYTDRLSCLVCPTSSRTEHVTNYQTLADSVLQPLTPTISGALAHVCCAGEAPLCCGELSIKDLGISASLLSCTSGPAHQQRQKLV